MSKASFWTRMWEDDFERREREMREYQEQAAAEAVPRNDEARRDARLREAQNRLTEGELQGHRNKVVLTAMRYGRDLRNLRVEPTVAEARAEEKRQEEAAIAAALEAFREHERRFKR